MIPRKGSAAKTLDRVISQHGIGSRSQAREWIAKGRVSVNGAIVRDPDRWADPARDRITFDGKRLARAEPLYLLLYKPTGYVTTLKDPEGRPTVYELLKGVTQFVGTVGRLDLETSGLLLLTNDTLLADRLTDPGHHVPKRYLAKAAGILSDEQLERLHQGVTLDDGPTRPAEVVRVRNSARHTFLEIAVTEGRNRQVRRMIEAVGSRVLKLVRTRIGPLEIGTLKIGTFRKLSDEEVRNLKELVGLGSVEPSVKPPGLSSTKTYVDRKPQGKLLVPSRNQPLLGRRGGKPGLRDRTRASGASRPTRPRV